MHRNVLACLILAASALPALAATTDGPTQPVLSPERVGWTRVGLEAHKLFITATTIAAWTIEDTERLAGRLQGSPEGSVIAPGARVLQVNYQAELPGMRSDTTLWMDPGTGNSLQYEIRDSGKRNRLRVVRFTDSGAYQRTRRPRPGEEQAPPASWSDESAGFWPYGQRLTAATVLDSLGLLYFIAGADLRENGDRADVLVFQSRELVRVGLAVDGQEKLNMKYQAQGEDGVRTCKGAVQTLRVRLSVQPFGAASPDFDFLGLKSDIVIYVEPASRLPMRIDGRAAVLGRVTSNLKNARLKGAVRCPGMN